MMLERIGMETEDVKEMRRMTSDHDGDSDDNDGDENGQDMASK